jgi:hypothetical protein
VTEREWYERHGCDHAHCPFECEHPQPFMIDGDLVRGRCVIKNSEIVKMIPCTPDVCS